MSPRYFETVQDSDTEIIEQVTYRRRTKKGIKTTYKQVRSDQPPVEKSGQASNTRSRTQRQTKLRNEKQLEPHTAKATQPEEDDIGYMDTHEFIDEQEDNINDISPEGMQTLPTVWSCLSCFNDTSNDAQSTMSQWLQYRGRYLDILLEMEGYLLCLGHAGEPCPKTVEGVKASRKRRTRAAASSSLRSVEEEDGSLVDTADHIRQLPTPRATPQPDGPTTAPAISNTLFDFLDTPIDSSRSHVHRTRTGRNGNPLITSIDCSGVFEMEVLFCACSDAYSKDEQLLRAGLFPSTFKQIENIFTFAVLDNFLTDNLECKTTAQQYYSKLQSMTSAMFPDHVPNRYKQLLRASRQWRDLKNRMQTGLGYQAEQETPQDGSMAIFCPACPQPGINLPDDWKVKYPQTFIMDGNFSAEHMRYRTREDDIALSPGMAFLANPDLYKAHLRSGAEMVQPSTCNTYKAIEQANSSRPHLDVTGIGATACHHGFFVPTSVVDFQKGERICKALSYNMEDIPVALVMKGLQRAQAYPCPSSMELRTGIGLFHIHGHQDSCLPRYSPSFIPGAKQVDGEIIETLWAPLNNISRSLHGMTLAHRQEVLDAHMNLFQLEEDVPSLLKHWKCLEDGLALSAEAFMALTKRFKKQTKGWLKDDQAAQWSRDLSPEAMDIYDTAKEKAPSCAMIQQELVSEESGDSSVHGQTSWIACGLKIQEMQFTEDAPTLPLGDYSEFDHVDSVDGSGASHTTGPSSPTHHHTPRTSDGSGINNVNAEDISILLPSTLGWEWCVQHSVQSLAEKEARLQYAQATDSIHSMRLALGFKSALFRDQVRPANTQWTKTRVLCPSRGVVQGVVQGFRVTTAKTLKEGLTRLELRKVVHKMREGLFTPKHKTIWGKPHEEQRGHTNGVTKDDRTETKIRDAYEGRPELSELQLEDLRVNTEWTVNRVHWLRAKAQFQRWMEEQASLHNEAEWVPAYFHAKAEQWKVLMSKVAQRSQHGHEAYASQQMYLWEELSRSSEKALSPITSAPLQEFRGTSLYLS
ncbi:hypothetical protein BJY52DRAFT_1230227 [Lactarius psammicola]|nr:hypothetical protein BJY52DRAFT_1230227 [Lactarius psammicola]